jgi:hypothetical protein
VNHYRQRELATDHTWKTHSTKVTYQGYLNKWILPRWESYTLPAIKAGDVEQWLRSLPLARASCAKIRNLMSVLFNHGIRYQVCSGNPIRLVRQSAKRRKIPVVLSVSEVQQLLDALALREWILVLLDVSTGLRMSELFGLKWKDVDFEANEISVVRSIVMQVTGPCKTEASQKPIPLDPCLAEALRAWRQQARYNRPEDWIFASAKAKGDDPIGDNRSCAKSYGLPRFKSGSPNPSAGTPSAIRIRPCCGPPKSTSRSCRNCFGTPLVGSPWTRTRRPLPHKNAKLRVALFACFAFAQWHPQLRGEVVPFCAHEKAIKSWEMKFWNGRMERSGSPAVPFCAYDKSAPSL